MKKILTLALTLGFAIGALAAPKKVVMIAGPQSHGPLSHEHRAGILLLAKCLKEDSNATKCDVQEAVAICEDVDRRARRVLGSAHPFAKETRGTLERARQQLANFKPK